tara:strand:+ start:465 stop:1244 length:780 start_codon:yes stop_codon:yes gene_type:complete
MSLLKADTIKPVTSSGDLSLQGDSGGSAVDCLNITSAGDINFTGNTDAKIKLPSAGGLYESDGSTPVLTESGGIVSLGSGVVLPSGLVLQVQNTQITDIYSMTSIAADTDYTIKNGTASGGTEILNVNITPAVTGSTIWVQVSWCGENSNVNQPDNSVMFIYRNAVKLANTATVGSRHGGIMPHARSSSGADSASSLESCFYQYFDLHGITAGTQITYKAGFRGHVSSDTLFTNRTVDDSDSTYYERGVSSICAMEIAP